MGKRKFNSLRSLSKDKKGTKNLIIEFLNQKKGHTFFVKELKEALNLPVKIMSPDLVDLINSLFPEAQFKSISKGTRCFQVSYNKNGLEEANPKQEESKEIKPALEEEQHQDLRKAYAIGSKFENFEDELNAETKDFFVKLTKEICEKQKNRGIYLDDLWSIFDKYRIKRGFNIVRALVESGSFNVTDRISSATSIRRPYVQLIEEPEIKRKPEHLFLVPTSIKVEKETLVSDLGDKKVVDFDPNELTKSEVLTILKTIYLGQSQVLTSDKDKIDNTITTFENILKEE